MLSMRLGLLLLAACALLPMPGSSARADPYKWCAHYAGRDGEFGSECYYLTHAQCMQSISGVGGWCEPNPFYDGRPVEDEYSRPRPAPRHQR